MVRVVVIQVLDCVGVSVGVGPAVTVADSDPWLLFEASILEALLSLVTVSVCVSVFPSLLDVVEPEGVSVDVVSPSRLLVSEVACGGARFSQDPSSGLVDVAWISEQGPLTGVWVCTC